MDGRAHHPARHRQRHVAADLRLGRVSSFPAPGARLQRREGHRAARRPRWPWPSLLLVAIVFIEQGQRRIPVQFAKRVVGRRMYGGQSTYIPLKVNQSRRHPDHLRQLGAVPADPAHQRAAGRRLGRHACSSWSTTTSCSPTRSSTSSIYGLLIIGFAYFYTAIAFDPAQQADTIRKQGGFIPGIRPGPQTERYLAKILQPHHAPGRPVHRRHRPAAVACCWPSPTCRTSRSPAPRS